MRKVDKEFLLTDDSVNCYGYRLLTSGLRLEKFNPPIGFFMHNRETGVAVRWEDLTIRNNALYGKPVIDESKFPNLAKQIEEGFYAAASVGHIVALKWSENPEDMVDGQTGPTITEWYPRECSIVDIPGNSNAVAQDRLFDEKGNVLMDLSDNKQNNINMETAVITVEALMDLSIPNLASDASAEQALEVIQGLAEKAEKYAAIEQELANLKAEMVNFKEKTLSEKIDGVVFQAMADHKINLLTADRLKADYRDNYEGLRALLKAMPAQTSLAAQIKPEFPAQYQGKTWQDLYKQGTLADVKKKYPDLYERLVQERDEAQC